MLPFLLLSACATIDISNLDTALPLSPRKFRVSPYYAIAPDLDTLVNEEEYENEIGPLDMSDIELWIVAGLKADLACAKSLDLQARATVAHLSYCYQVGFKKYFGQWANLHFALSPYVSWGEGDFEGLDDDLEPRVRSDRIRSAGLKFLLTRKFELASITLAPAANYSVLSEEKIATDANDEEYFYELCTPVLHGGAILTGSVSFNSLINIPVGLNLIPEIGLHVIKPQNRKTTVLPVFALAMGLEF